MQCNVMLYPSLLLLKNRVKFQQRHLGKEEQSLVEVKTKWQCLGAEGLGSYW